MPQTDISSAVASDLTTAVTDYSVDSVDTEAAGDQQETEWLNPNWSQWFGYYKTIPELNSVIDAMATWTVGKGFTADEGTTSLLEGIRGWGKDTFNSILENAIRTYHIGGDAFLEVMRNEQGQLVNLKPLDPGVMKIVVDRKGILKRYEQVNKVRKTNKRFEVEEIFHLARNRVADEIHGVSIVEKLIPIILMRNEAMTDMKTVFHRYVKPFNIFYLDTDDTTKIAAFKAKQDAVTESTENMYIPKGAVEIERHGMPQFSTLNPLPWIDVLNQYFFQAARVPDIILGSSKEFTEASAKIAYLAFQQNVEEEQLFIEANVRLQLGLDIELTFPASLENEMLSDQKKDAGQGASQPNDTQATMGGKT